MKEWQKKKESIAATSMFLLIKLNVQQQFKFGMKKKTDEYSFKSPEQIFPQLHTYYYYYLVLYVNVMNKLQSHVMCS